jgi:hypothetical protein
MRFSQRLAELIRYAEEAGKQRIRESLDAFVGTLVDGLGDDWSKFDQSTLTQDADDAGEGAIWLDAVACARSLADEHAAHADIALANQTPSDVAAEVDRLFSSRQLPAKGLVYVLWDESPESYSFVGRASSRKKLDFTGKGGLARALSRSATLSLIVPNRGGQAQLEALASSIIHLIRCKMEEDPRFNEDVTAEMPDSVAWKPIEALSDLLEEAGVHLYNRAKTGED